MSFFDIFFCGSTIRAVSITTHSRNRQSMRLRDYDYTTAGAYFVTICTHGRELILDGVDLAHAVERTWWSLGKYAAGVRGGPLVVMPNHVHGIIWLTRSVVGAQHVSSRSDHSNREVDLVGNDLSCSARAAPLPTVRRSLRVEVGSLGAIVRAFKSTSTKRINQLRGTPGGTVWQRGYYDRVIRGDAELARVRQYIRDNPAKWDEDRNNPFNLAKSAVTRRSSG